MTVTGAGRIGGNTITIGPIIAARDTGADMLTTATEVIAGMMVIGIVDSIIRGDRSADAAGGTTAMQTEMANRAGTTDTAIIVRQTAGLRTGNSG